MGDDKMKVVVLLSGGLDSSTLLYHFAKDSTVFAVSFDYGQRHKRELRAALDLTNQLGVLHHVFDLRDVGYQISLNTALVNPTIDVPEGRYDEESMKSTIVPNRNAIMLSIAYGVAVANEYDAVAFAAHSGDHAIYPDCRDVFADAFALAMTLGNEPHKVELFRPFIGFTKAQIVMLGATLGVPYEHTWSCYKGGSRHCGRCGTCVERAEAFFISGVVDPTEYEDPTYWRTVVKGA
jgi:7-cyano-7-deazaguanine synthase